MTTTMEQPVRTPTTGPQIDTTLAVTATELLHAMVALPADHPSRPALRERAINAWLPLARHLASRYTGRGEPADDLAQTAALGLIKAIDRFDPSRGVDFAGYAIPTIVGEIRRHFRDRTWDIRVPRRLQELRMRLSQAGGALPQILGRSPTIMDIATYLRITEEEVLEGLESARAYNGVSLSAPASHEGRTTELGDTLGNRDAGFELAELRMTLGPAVSILDQREQRILTLRFHGNLTQSQIAEQIGVSQMHISRLLNRALGKLRAHLADFD